MPNKPNEPGNPSVAVGSPKPGDFPLGSIESRAAARFLAGKRKGALIPVMRIQINNVGDIASYNDGAEHGTSNSGSASNPPSLCLELDPMSMGNTPVNWMTRRELDTKQHEFDEYERQRAKERDASRPRVKEVEETKPERVSPIAPETAREQPAASTDIQPADDDAAREARVKAYMESQRRPIARKPWYRRRLWPDGVWR